MFRVVTPQPLKFCVDCKHFRHPVKGDAKYGTCTRFGKINLVDGSVEFPLAASVRPFECKERFFEENSKNVLDD